MKRRGFGLVSKWKTEAFLNVLMLNFMYHFLYRPGPPSPWRRISRCSVNVWQINRKFDFQEISYDHEIQAFEQVGDSVQAEKNQIKMNFVDRFGSNDASTALNTSQNECQNTLQQQSSS